MRVGARVSFEFSSKTKEWVATAVFLVLGKLGRLLIPNALGCNVQDINKAIDCF